MPSINSNQVHLGGLWVEMGDSVILDRYHRLEPDYRGVLAFTANYMISVNNTLCASMLNGMIFAWPYISVWVSEDDNVGNCLSEDVFNFNP